MSKPYEVICVDLDRTLIRTDLSQEAIISLLRFKPWLLLFLPFWALKGLPYLKAQLVRHVSFDVKILPYNYPLIRYLRAMRKEKKIVLATASPEVWGRQVAAFVGGFDEVLGTTADFNLKGSNKSRVLEERFGAQGYCYIGDSRADLKVWEKSESAILITGSKSLIKQAKKLTHVEQVFTPPAAGWLAWLKTLRVHQWVKNFLIFLPLLLAHAYNDVDRVWHTVVGFFLFGITASAVYVVNDLFDLESDRRHPVKRKRAFASGRLTLPSGVSVAGGLMAISLLLGYGCFGWAYCEATLIYVITVLAYSFHFKKLYALDVLLLAGFYTFRIYLGGIVADVLVSSWLAAFSMFFFLNLAFIKRYVELKRMDGLGKKSLDRRGYHAEDLSMVQSMGTSCGYVSVLIFTIYINSEAVARLYQHMDALWIVSGMLLFWVTRLWFMAGRGEIDDDPIVFTLKDFTSYIVWGSIALLFWIAI